ncbi:hypothetical protein AVEN_215521-1 [Araneus ventricosus]|uniref:Uncharacterized protein n=1 Tax=Araneus ventricosus TaxID=182803 RepID=A0A4Y2BEX2_ARAVE|nr:hypothetical protein AVEN_215521-1 [Araneus ventricosus]
MGFYYLYIKIVRVSTFMTTPHSADGRGEENTVPRTVDKRSYRKDEDDPLHLSEQWSKSMRMCEYEKRNRDTLENVFDRIG